MKIALAQTNIVWENKKKNYRNAEKFIQEAKAKECRIILLPEMSFTGFSMKTEITRERDNDTIVYMQTLAQRNHISIGFGWVKDCGEKAENHYSVVNERGEILADYVKIHPFSYSGEDKKFQGGKETVFFSLDNIRFSTFICYDLRFPEIFQAVSGRAEVIIVPANWPAARAEHWKCLLRARAIENQVYIVGINCVGDIGGVEYSGDSCIINPNGEIIQMISQKEKLLVCDIEDDVQKWRSMFPMKLDRKNELYISLMGKN